MKFRITITRRYEVDQPTEEQAVLRALWLEEYGEWLPDEKRSDIEVKACP